MSDISDPIRIAVEHEDFLRAARGREVSKCAGLLEKDPSLINAIEAGGFCALHFAAFNGDLPMIELLLKYKPNLELTNYDGNTPLMMAAKVKQHAAIKVLVDAGANVNFQASGGRTAAHFAASMGNPDTVRYLVSLGAATKHDNSPSGTLLHWAAHSGSISCVGPMLYEFGVPIDAKDGHGGTALFTALFMKKSEVVQFLLEHGANPNAVIDGDNATPLHIAVEHGDLEDVKSLIAFGAQPSAADKDGDTPLSLAEKKGSKAIIRELSKPQKDQAARLEDAARFKTHGNRVFAEGENVKAAKFYTQAIQNEPTNHVYFSNRAACYFNQRYNIAAYYDSCRCVTLAPNWPRGYFRKAAAAYALRNVAEAKVAIEAGLKIDKDNKDLITLLDQINKDNSK